MTDTASSAGMLDVHVSPHPFTVERTHRRLPAGASLAEIAALAQPDGLLRKHAHMFINGHAVPCNLWARVRPRAGTTVTIRMTPMGGGGKNPLRTILSLAIVAASPMIAGALAGYMGAAAQASFLGLSAGKLVTAGVNLLGRLALNALAPPGSPRFGGAAKESPTLFIQGARNQAYPFGRVPKVLGRHRQVPPMGALPYTETVGNDQYLRMLFVWGYGPLHISDLKIGETPLVEFDGVEVETRQGFDDDAPVTLYSNSVLQNNLEINIRQADGYVMRTTETEADEISVDITLPRGLLSISSRGTRRAAEVALEVQYSPAGENDWSAGAEAFKSIAGQTVTGITRPGAYVYGGVSHVVTRVDRIVLDAASGTARVLRGTDFRIGLDAGKAQPPEVPAGLLPLARVERRSDDDAVIPTERITNERGQAFANGIFQASGNFAVTADDGDDSLAVAAGGLKFRGIVLTGKQSSALRASASFRVPPGQYDVRLRRLTADADDDQVFDETIWTALRTLRHAYPVSMPGLAVTALRIKATDQMSGIVDRFNGVVHSILPDWNGSAWVEQVTSNPASLFRHVLQGRGNARPLPDARLDLLALQDWHDRCAAAGRQFDAVVDYDVSVREMLQDIASAGRASPSLRDGKWSVVEDRAQSVPVQHFTPHNTFGFEGRKAFDEVPEALRVRFINRARGWLQDERLVFRDGITAQTATRYESLQLTGVTDANEAWKHGRYHLATAQLRPETYSFYCDIEHLVCTRGDLIRLTHDVPLFGLKSGRVAARVADPENPAIITGVTLTNAVEMEAEKAYAVRFRKNDGATLLTGVQTAAGQSPALVFVTPLDANTAPQAGDLFMFGESGQESVEMIVRAIEPQNGLKARVTCVDAAPGIYAADSGLVPLHQSQISVPPEMQRPPMPVLARIQSGAEALIRHTDGSLTTRVVMTLEPPGFARALSVQASIRARGESAFRAAEVLSQHLTQVSVTDVEEGETYDIRLRYVSDTGSFSSPLVISGYRVEGTAGVPSDVTGLSLNVLGDSAHLSWPPVRDLDLHHYRLRFSPLAVGAVWSGAVDLVGMIPMDTTAVTVPAATGTYLLKAVDIGGRESRNAVQATSTVAALDGYNAIAVVEEGPDFAGERTALQFFNGGLALSPLDTLDAWQDIDAVANVDTGEAGLAQSGVYEFAQTADLGAVYTSRLTAALTVAGVDLNNSLDTQQNIDDIEFWDQDVDPSLWSVTLQVQRTEDDPEEDAVWSGWENFMVGDYSARAFRFRALLEAEGANVTPVLYGVDISIDMPDRTTSQRGLTSDPAGSTVSFARGFHAPPAIAVTAQNMQAGDRYVIDDVTADGFDIRFLNDAEEGIARTFDYFAKGFGEKP